MTIALLVFSSSNNLNFWQCQTQWWAPLSGVVFKGQGWRAVSLEKRDEMGPSVISCSLGEAYVKWMVRGLRLIGYPRTYAAHHAPWPICYVCWHESIGKVREPLYLWLAGRLYSGKECSQGQNYRLTGIFFITFTLWKFTSLDCWTTMIYWTHLLFMSWGRNSSPWIFLHI